MASERIHIVEDSLVTSFHLRTLLENGGYKITGVSNTGEKALREIKSLRPDLVLMDIMLGGEMCGTEVAGVLKDQYDIPVIYISSFTDRKTIQKAKVTQPYGYLVKPFNEREILTTVEMGLYRSCREKKRRQEIVDQANRDMGMVEMKQQLAELRLDALQSVMNPHFIFNALNSIQYLIANHDREKAMNYLSTFSKVIRSILGHAGRGRILLKDELELLQNYIDLEQLRFENKFVFSLKIEEGLDVDGIELPALLVQPYLENAIVHSLSAKSEPANLEVCVTEERENLLFKIEYDSDDDKAAARFLQNLPRPDTGLISEERMRLVTQGANVEVEAINIKVAEKNKIGTRVLISMPLKTAAAIRF